MTVKPPACRRLAATLACSAAVGSLYAGHTASAASFAVSERSAKAQGSVYAGATAGGPDVSFIGFNPAALGNVERGEVASSITYLQVQVKGTASNPFIGGDDVTFDPSKDAVLPALSFGWRVGEKTVIGFAMNAPFGLASDYPNNAALYPAGARALKSEFKLLEATPMVSYSPIDDVTLGLGLTAAFADGSISSGLGAPVDDSWPVGRLEGDDVGFSVKVGALWDVTEGTTIGLSYARGYEIELDGRFTAPGLSTTAEGTFNVPSIFGAGIRSEVWPGVELMADFRYFFFNSFDAVRVNLPGGTEITNNENAIYASVGTEVDVTDTITLRAGIGWEETPTVDETRSPRIPDADRIVVGFGATYRLGESLDLDFAYNYWDFLDTDVRANGTTIPTDINYDSHVHAITLGLAYRF
ncbi:MAG: outer membrane protein transport protein [Pseudomonadota bacterium]